jgi:hypothetical protein
MSKLLKSHEESCVGKELKNCFLDDMTTIYSYNHYNYYYTYDDSIDFLIKYFTEKNDISIIDKIKKIPKYYIPVNVGWIAKLLINNCQILDMTQEYFDKHIDKIQKYKKEVVVVENNQKIVSYENYDLIFFESILDQILKDEVFEIQIIDNLKSRNVSQINAKFILDYYSDKINQINNIEYKEYYSSVPKKRLVRLKEFYIKIEDDINVYLNNKKRERKPRKTKVKSVEKKISLIRLQKESNELRVNSLSSDKILTSDVLLLYNTKYNVLYLLFSEANKKFDVHRSAIMNIDITKSFSRTLKKPIDNIQRFSSGTKSVMIKNFNELTSAKKSVDSFYTNENVILLRCF